MIKLSLAVFLLAVLLPAELRAEPLAHSAFPVDITMSAAPQPVTADGRVRLVYELHLTNFYPKPVDLTGLDVLGNGDRVLTSYRGEAVEKLLMSVGAADDAGNARTIGGGRSVVIFLDLALEPGVTAPARLRHRFTLATQGKDRAVIEKTFDGPAAPVVQAPAPVLRSPLAGAGWVAFNGLANPDHRRSFVAVDGREWIAQRFAIDWARLGPDRRLLHGDPKVNASYYAYGAPVLAVANARVSDLKDGMPDNAGSNVERAQPVTLDTIAGNYLILDLGGGTYALYAHLQPGSLKVKVGDHVRAGRPLALLGNTGNSDEPHLHFQLMNANAPLAAEGLPYAIDSFTQTGVLDDPAVLDTGQPWRPKTVQPTSLRRDEFPVDNAVVTFR